MGKEGFYLEDQNHHLDLRHSDPAEDISYNQAHFPQQKYKGPPNATTRDEVYQNGSYLGIRSRKLSA